MVQVVDEIGAIPAWIPDALMFDSNDARFLVIHKTAGFHTAQEVAQYFQSGSNGLGVSAHYVVGQDGTIIQCVPESRGAGANCCVSPGHAGFIPNTWDGRQDNGNLHSISIEHVDPALDNSSPLTLAQKRASFNLILHICKRHGIPMRYPVADGRGGICRHGDIDPVNRARCPGNFPFDELYTYLRLAMSDQREQQARLIWASTAHLFAGVAPDITTDIGAYWLILARRGMKPGPPITPEYSCVDWNGNAITAQEFAGGHAEKNKAGTVVFYDLYGAAL
jgi:N-acetyl-anhydromuramyl-L-alanine amidase AmpD